MSQRYISPLQLLSVNAHTSAIFFIAIASYWAIFILLSFFVSRYLSYPVCRMDIANIFGWNTYTNVAGDESDIKTYPQGMGIGGSSILSKGYDFYNNIGDDITGKRSNS